MGIKSNLLHLLPSYRTKDALLEELCSLTKKVNNLDCRIEAIQSKSDYLFWLSQNREGESLFDTKKRFFLSIPKAEGKSLWLQKGNNYILTEIKKICDQNDISFVLLGGTLIGAIRHAGFIPWDDDIDIGMFRSEYERLCECLKSQSELEVHNYYDYSMKSKYIKVKLSESDTFFVDIFIFDYISVNNDNIIQRWEETKKTNLSYSNELFSLMSSNPIFEGNHSKTLPSVTIDTNIAPLERSILSYHSYYGQGNAVCLAIDNARWSREAIKIYYLDDILPVKKNFLKFEGNYYDVFSNYMELLENQYGDIWSFPKSFETSHSEDFEDFNEKDIQLLQAKGVL